MKWTRLVIGCLLVVMIPLGLNVWTGAQPTSIEETTHQAASYTPEPYEPSADDGASSYLVLGAVGVAVVAAASRALAPSTERS